MTGRRPKDCPARVLLDGANLSNLNHGWEFQKRVPGKRLGERVYRLQRAGEDVLRWGFLEASGLRSSAWGSLECSRSPQDTQCAGRLVCSGAKERLGGRGRG